MAEPTHTLEHVKTVGEAAGLILLDDAYEASRVPMHWRCAKPECGYLWTAPFRLVSWGRTCPGCKGRAPWTQAKAAEQAKKNGFELVKADMETRKATLACPEGHEWTTTFHGIKTCQCPKCFAQKRHQTMVARLTAYVQDKGGTVLSANFDSRNTKIPLKCARGHLFSANYRSLINMGSYCPQCGNIDRIKP